MELREFILIALSGVAGFCLFIIAAIAILAGSADLKTAVMVLEAAKYTDVKVNGSRPFACGERYRFHTLFKAITVNGKSVSGVVCSGWGQPPVIEID